MTPKYNLALNRGESFQKSFTYLDAVGTPVNLTPYTVESHLKLSYADTTPAAVFTASMASASLGVFQLELSPSASVSLTQSCYLYDVRLVSGSTVKYILEGKVNVSPSVTL